MPRLNGSGHRQDAEQQTWNKLDDRRDDQQFLAIEGVGHRAGEQTENDEREGLKKPRKAKLQRRAGNLVDLIQSGNVAYLDSHGSADAGDPHQSIVANGERSPRASGRYLGARSYFFRISQRDEISESEN